MNYTIRTSRGPVRWHSVGEPIVEQHVLEPYQSERGVWYVQRPDEPEHARIRIYGPDDLSYYQTFSYVETCHHCWFGFAHSRKVHES